MFSRIVLRYRRLIILNLLTLFLVCLIISNYDTNKNSPAAGKDSQNQSGILNILSDHHADGNQEKRSSKRLAILVPFRDRFDELLVFVPHISKFLTQQNIANFNIYVLNQSSRYRFNRGALANVGYMLAKNTSDYIAIHDVDLIPVNKNLSYAFPETGPFHLSAPEYHPKYNYAKYFGGILLMNNKHFELVNGFSNRYFGWGMEDDEFLTRIEAARLPITRPVNLTTDKNNTFLHYHYGRRRDYFKSKEQRDVLRHRDLETGLKDLKYLVTSSHNITLDDEFKCLVFNIELYCDTSRTSWCLPQAVTRSRNKSKSATVSSRYHSSG